MASPSPTPNPILEGALGYARRGWPVFPVWWLRDSGRCACGKECQSPGKHPLGEAVPNGLRQATTDPEVIAFWWEKYPRARVGLTTGGELAVVDVDVRHQGDDTLADAERVFGKLPDAPTAMTPSGGWHLFFRKTGFLKSKANALGHGVDTRSDGGYVVAAPSPGYVWDAARNLDDLELPELPEWVYRVVNLGSTDPSKQATTSPDANAFIEGGRNDALTQLAGAMRRRGMGGEEILGALLVTNRIKCRPSLDEAEVKRIAYGIERYAPTDPVKPGEPDKPRDRFVDPLERARRLGQRGTRMPTGFPTLDRATRGGLVSGRTLVIGGAPGAGKTTLGLQLVRNYAMLGHPWLVFASDEEADGLLIRWGQNENLARGELEKGADAAKDVLVERLSLTGPGMLVDQEEDEATVEEAIGAFVEKVTQDASGLRPVVFFDSLQTMQSKTHEKVTSTRERLDLSVRVFKRTAKRLDFLSIATSELARGSYRSTDAKDRTDDLAAFKESGGIEYGVTTAIVLRSVKDSPNRVEVSMPKNRLGQQLGFVLDLDRDHARFSEIVSGAPAAPGAAGRALPPEARLKLVERAILEELRKHQELSAGGLQERIEARRQTLLVALEQLVGRGVVLGVGKGSKARFTLATAPGREAENDS